jgi:sirohydrochlorin ferrochelatase
MPTGLLLIDHGSRLAEANDMLVCVANLVQDMAGSGVIVRHAHMELAEPSIARGFADCVGAGADEVIAFPYMLSPGRHSTRDIPRMIREAAEAHPGVRYGVTPAFGVHEMLAAVVLSRAGLTPVRQAALDGGSTCWAEAGGRGEEADCNAGRCADACPAREGKANSAVISSPGSSSE